jgi:hypothetical protein
MKRILLASAAIFLSAATTTITLQPGDSVTINVPMPGPVLTMGVDLSKAMKPAVGYSTARVQPGPSGTLGSDGAFRVLCAPSHMLMDDPIVFPGQPGASHLHTFFGNTGASASSTVGSMATSGNSTCDGGILNRSSYWVPSLIDTKDGSPLVPNSANIYYKATAEFNNAGKYVPVPPGLRMVSGNAKNTNPAAGGANWLCYDLNGNSGPWTHTIPDTIKYGTCVTGGSLVMGINFPICWDGKNLDSPDHKSHIVGVAQNQNPPYEKFCPADHPVVLPQISFVISYPITDPAAVARWKLSSDLMLDPTLPGGVTGHADYFMGWDVPTMQTFVTNCLNGGKDCADDLLGNGQTLF